MTENNKQESTGMQPIGTDVKTLADRLRIGGEGNQEVFLGDVKIFRFPTPDPIEIAAFGKYYLIVCANMCSDGPGVICHSRKYHNPGKEPCYEMFAIATLDQEINDMLLATDKGASPTILTVGAAAPYPSESGGGVKLVDIGTSIIKTVITNDAYDYIYGFARKTLGATYLVPRLNVDEFQKKIFLNINGVKNIKNEQSHDLKSYRCGVYSIDLTHKLEDFLDVDIDKMIQLNKEYVRKRPNYIGTIETMEELGSGL